MSDRDPYDVLAVERTASQKAIRRAYRSQAKKYHPDLNPGDAAAEKQFKEAASAYSIIGEAEKRARFDRGEINTSGQESPKSAFSQASGSRSGFTAQEGFASEAELREHLNEMFGNARARSRPRPAQGSDVVMTISVPFLEACRGGVRRIRMPGRTALDVTLPAGLRDGELVRMRGQGQPGFDGGPAGDAYIEAHIEPHRFFRREDANIHLDLPITFAEAVLGATVRAPTIQGLVDLKVPANAKADARLRLRGKGVDDRKNGFGDQFVRLIIEAPDQEDEELKQALAAWAERHKENPRAAMEQAL